MAVHRRGWFGGLGAVLAALLVAGVMLAPCPAVAQDRDHDERGRAPERGGDRRDARPPDRHARVDRGRRVVRPVYGYDAPTYVPDPPPVVYAPPAPSGGLSFFFNFR